VFKSWQGENINITINILTFVIKKKKAIRKDLEINELDPNMVYNRTLWRNLIHVADPI